jgi:hypothetical protein
MSMILDKFFCIVTLPFLMYLIKCLDENLISLQLGIYFLSKRAESKISSPVRQSRLHLVLLVRIRAL